MLEGTRWSETWSRAAVTIPSRQSRFERAGTLPRQPLRVSPTQWRVYVATSEPGSIVQIAARSILAEVDVIESLQYLMSHGLVRRVQEVSSSLGQVRAA